MRNVINSEALSRIGFGEKVKIDINQKKKVLITGANSYIGTSFEKYANNNYSANFEIDTIDMKDEAWKSYDFSKYDTVFHVAGIAHADIGKISEDTKQKYYKVNTQLAIETAEKAKKSGVKQFVYMSSIIIYGESAPFGKQKVITKDSKPEPANFYGDSKWQADKGIRELSDNKFNVLVLRPPMIYGKGSKGNYPTLAKLARKLPIFPDIKNERSMLFIDNLCEFLCQVMLVGKGGIFFPQNKEYTNTIGMIEDIRHVVEKKTIKLKLLNIFVKLGQLIPGKIKSLINKAFGNLVIDQELSVYEGLEYRKVSLRKSIEITEKQDQDNVKKKICIVNCFDTYEHRVDLLYNYFYKKDYDVKVFTSNYRHIEKNFRTDTKENFIFVNAQPYKKNMSIDRLVSHIRLSRDIFKHIKNEKPDLLWVLIPPNSFAKDAAKYRKKHNVKLVFDLIDMWPETMPISKFKSLPPFIYWKNLRNKYLRYADEIVTECDLYRTVLPTNISKESIHTLYLARKVNDRKLNLQLPNEKISLCYLGSINNIIDIPCIKNVIENLKKIKPVDIHIIGDGENRDTLIKACEEAGANVIFHGKIYDQNEKNRIFDQCHYGLNIMKDSVFVGLTMKSIDYFEAGLPIINNIKGDTWKFVEENNIGANILYNTDYKKIAEYENIKRSKIKEFFEKNFSIEEFENRIIKLKL